MTPFGKTSNKKLAQARDMFTDDEMKISDPKAAVTAVDLAVENARLQKEIGDVLDYYTRTVEELQAENMRLREALQMVQNRLNEHGTGVCSFTGDEWTKIDRALAGAGDVPH